MQTYQYHAVGTDGKPARGVVQAQDEFAAVQKIKAKYPIITEISEVKASNSSSILNMEIGSSKVSAKNLSVMCAQFAIMLKSGLPIARCMEMVANQTADKRLKKDLGSAAEDVAEGGSVATAFEKNIKGLPPTFIETIRAGEESGTIDRSFSKMKDYYEKSYKNADKLKSALTYPIFVIIIAIIVIIIVMAKVIPTLADTFSDLGGELPTLTKIMIATSNWFARWWILLIIFILAAVVGWKIYSATEKGRIVRGKVLLKLPVIGHINLMSGSAQFADTMSAMLASGLTVNKALETTAKTMNNAILSRDVSNMVGMIESGRSLGECIRKCECFPDNLKEMCAIGEETGALDETLDTVGEYYNNETDQATKDALAKLEPTILVFLAAFAGLVVVSIYLPMFTMYNLF